MFKDKRMQEEDFREYLQEIVDLKGIEGKELGITKRAIDKGVETLTEAQLGVLKYGVIKHYYVDKCKLDGGDIPWSEMIFACDNDGHCAYCANRLEKLAAE